jgi:hypothetical protein
VAAIAYAVSNTINQQKFEVFEKALTITTIVLQWIA